MSDDTFIATWNIHTGVECKGNLLEIKNRTNNALENYNKRIKKIFSCDHPVIFDFVNSLEVETSTQVKRLDDFRSGRSVCRDRTKQSHKSMNMYLCIPSFYRTFELPSKQLGTHNKTSSQLGKYKKVPKKTNLKKKTKSLKAKSPKASARQPLKPIDINLAPKTRRIKIKIP